MSRTVHLPPMWIQYAFLGFGVGNFDLQPDAKFFYQHVRQCMGHGVHNWILATDSASVFVTGCASTFAILWLAPSD